MKTGILTLLLAISTFVWAEEKIYFPLDKLSFTEEGIFLKKGGCILQLPAIGYDEQGYYFAGNLNDGVTVEKCLACGYFTWWIEKHCCLREECPYYCY